MRTAITNDLGTKHYINLSDACSWFGFFIIVFALHVHRCIEALKRVLSWTFSLRIFGEDKKKKKKNVTASLWCCRQTWSSFAQTEVKSQLVTLAPENWSSLGADNSWGQIYRPTFHPNRDLCQLSIKCFVTECLVQHLRKACRQNVDCLGWRIFSQMFSHLKRITTLKETHHIAPTMQKMADTT